MQTPRIHRDQHVRRRVHALVLQTSDQLVRRRGDHVHADPRQLREPVEKLLVRRRNGGGSKRSPPPRRRSPRHTPPTLRPPQHPQSLWLRRSSFPSVPRDRRSRRVETDSHSRREASETRNGMQEGVRSWRGAGRCVACSGAEAELARFARSDRPRALRRATHAPSLNHDGEDGRLGGGAMLVDRILAGGAAFAWVVYAEGGRDCGDAEPVRVRCRWGTGPGWGRDAEE